MMASILTSLNLGQYHRLLGVAGLLLFLFGMLAYSHPNSLQNENLGNLSRRVGERGIITVGVGLVILTGGIDLSIGSVICLSAVSFGLFLENGWAPLPAALIVLLGSGLVGFGQGLLITKLRLQPFIVTLCGLFLWRGLAKFLTQVRFDHLKDWLKGNLLEGESLFRDACRDIGVGGRKDLDAFFEMETGHFIGLPMPAWIFVGIASLAWILIHATTHGRYMLAIGFNEKGAKYAGVNTESYKILSYTLCSLLSGLFGLLFLMDVGTASPNTAGNFYELYAITGAVLGGCSLRGGEGTVIGMALGTAVLTILQNLVNFAGVPSDLEFSVIGLALLGGTLFDEFLRRINTKSGSG